MHLWLTKVSLERRIRYVRNKHAYPVHSHNNPANVPAPPATTTHVPIPHHALVEGLVETLIRRHIGVVGEEFAVSRIRMYLGCWWQAAGCEQKVLHDSSRGLSSFARRFK
jgi:hypothetical protein